MNTMRPWGEVKNYPEIDGWRADPDTGFRVFVGDGAKIASGATIGDRTVIGSRVSIDDGASIGDRTIISYRAKIGPGARIGNWARIGDGQEVKR